MSEWTAAQIKELIGVQICAERRHRDVLREGDRQWIRDTLEAKDKALELLAAGYPTTEDFNTLRSQVEVVIAMFKVVSAIAVVFSAVTTYLLYLK